MEYSILLVEDQDEDFEVMMRALRGSSLNLKIERLKNGNDAIQYFSHCGIDENKKHPALIFLDLNLPGPDGQTLLAEIKRNSSLQHIPAIVITTSSDPKDVRDCYNLGANSYHIKSFDFPTFKAEMLRLVNYWLKDSLIPAKFEIV